MQTRQLWLDLARGLAVISMVIAHTAPVGGIFNVTEYLTAPLFGAALGAGVELAWRAWRGGAARFVGANAVRGAMLFLAGVLLQGVYVQIVVVLQWLGVLTVVVAVLVVSRVRGWVAIAAAAAALAAASPVMLAARAGGGDGAVVEFVAAGGPYRMLSMTAAGLLGVGLTRWLGRDTVSPRVTLTLALGGALVAGLAVVVGKGTEAGVAPYSGTYPEMVASLALVVAAMAGSRWLADVLPDGALRLLDPVVATGRLAMTAYVLQLVILRILTDVFLAGAGDDHWWVLLTTLATLVGVSWAWHRFVGQGPFEWLLRVHLPLFRR